MSLAALKRPLTLPPLLSHHNFYTIRAGEHTSRNGSEIRGHFSTASKCLHQLLGISLPVVFYCLIFLGFFFSFSLPNPFLVMATDLHEMNSPINLFRADTEIVQY